MASTPVTITVDPRLLEAVVEMATAVGQVAADLRDRGDLETAERLTAALNRMDEAPDGEP